MSRLYTRYEAWNNFVTGTADDDGCPMKIRALIPCASVGSMCVSVYTKY